MGIKRKIVSRAFVPEKKFKVQGLRFKVRRAGTRIFDALLIMLFAVAITGCISAGPKGIENPRYDTWAATWDTYRRALAAGDVASIENALKDGPMKKAFMDRLARLGPEALNKTLIDEWKDVKISDEHVSFQTDTFVNIAVNIKPLVGAEAKVMFMIQRVGDEWKIAFSETLENPPGGESEK